MGLFDDFNGRLSEQQEYSSSEQEKKDLLRVK